MTEEREAMAIALAIAIAKAAAILKANTKVEVTKVMVNQWGYELIITFQVCHFSHCSIHFISTQTQTWIAESKK